MKTTKVYKIVNPYKGKYYSANPSPNWWTYEFKSPPSFVVQYIPLRWARPKIEGSLLFSFRDLKRAKDWYTDRQEIWEAQALGARDDLMIDRCPTITECYIEDLWKNPPHASGLGKASDLGFILASSLRIIKRVTL